MKTHHVQILLFNGFSNMVLACALEPLRAVRDLLPGSVTWTVLSADNAPVQSSSGLVITPDCDWEDAGEADALVVICSYGFRDYAGAVTNSNLRRMSRRVRQVTGADTAAWLLASAGLLDRKAATIHWHTTPEFEEAFPRVTVRPERFVVDGAVATCGGASTTLDLTLKLIEEQFGAAVAFDVSTLFIHDTERQHETGRGARRLQTTAPPALRKAVTLMVEHIEEPLAMPALAQKCGLSERSLTRLFTAELGLSPGKYYQSLRLARARDLAASGRYPLSEVALRTGFASLATLSRAFTAQFGQTLSQARRKGRG
jgi:transcriptional regulator GlxA family with amidase domain